MIGDINKSFATIKVSLFEKPPVRYLTINNIVNLPVPFAQGKECKDDYSFFYKRIALFVYR